MKTVFNLVLASIFGAGVLLAKDGAPRGYDPISDLEKVKAEAVGKNRLVVVLVKGKDDSCPNCTATIANGERAIGSGVVKVFARAETLNAEGAADFEGALKDRVTRKFTTGVAVTFLVFNPDMSELLVEATRKELQSDKSATADFKKQVAEHKRALK